MKKISLTIFAVLFAACLSAPSTVWAQASPIKKMTPEQEAQLKALQLVLKEKQDRADAEFDSCVRSMRAAYASAKKVKDQKLLITTLAFIESKGNGELFSKNETKMKKDFDANKKQPDATPAYLASCEAMRKAFDKYASEVGKENEPRLKAYNEKTQATNAKNDATHTALVAATMTTQEKQLRTDVDACAKKLRVQLESHNKIQTDVGTGVSYSQKMKVFGVIESVNKEFAIVVDTRRSSHYSADNLKACEALIGNTKIKAAYDAAVSGSLEMAACVDKLKVLRASNTALKDDADKNFGVQKANVLKVWTDVDKKLDNMGKALTAATYNGDGKECTVMAANAEVRGAFDAAKKIVDAAAAAAKKAKEEADKQLAVAAAAVADKQKLAECVSGWKKRRDDASTRRSAAQASGAITVADLVPYDALYAQSTTEYGAILTTVTTLAVCQQSSTVFNNLEAAVAVLEQKVAVQKAAKAKAEKEEDEKAHVEYLKWIAQNPKEINKACATGCTARHNGPGPKQTECARKCTLAAAAVASGVTAALDFAVLKPLETALDQLGVSQKLCELASSDAAKFVEKAIETVGKLEAEVAKKAPAGVCTGVPLKCNYVKRFIQTAKDANTCRESVRSLVKSKDTAKVKFDKNKTAVDAQKAKIQKGDKSEDPKFKDTLKDAAVDASSACESPNAKAILEALVKPCVDAASGAAWLAANAEDLKK